MNLPPKDAIRVPHQALEAFIARVFTWPDPIGFSVDREGKHQGMALIEFPADHAVVWLPRGPYVDQDTAEQLKAAQRVLREWARL